MLHSMVHIARSNFHWVLDLLVQLTCASDMKKTRLQMHLQRVLQVAHHALISGAELEAKK